MLRIELSSTDEQEIKDFLELFNEDHVLFNDANFKNTFHIYTLRLLNDAYKKSNIQTNVTNDKQLVELKKENAQLKAQIKSLEKRKQDNSKNVSLSGIIGLYRSNNLSFQEIADKLNNEGRTNSRNNPFNKMGVQRLFKKYQSEQQKILKK